MKLVEDSYLDHLRQLRSYNEKQLLDIEIENMTKEQLIQYVRKLHEMLYDIQPILEK